TITNLAGETKVSGTFAEVAVNLTELFSVSATCSGHYGILNVRSSASDTETSSLEDWVSPVDLSVPSTCPTVRVNKAAQIAGKTDANGDQPFGDAALELTGRDNPQFGVTYPERSNGQPYEVGQDVTVGERVTGLPPGCENVTTGDLGTHTLHADG